jgi:hypothetical protein
VVEYLSKYIVIHLYGLLLPAVTPYMLKIHLRVLYAFSIYFTCHGIQSEIPSADPGEACHPIGALALMATAVSEVVSTLLCANSPTGLDWKGPCCFYPGVSEITLLTGKVKHLLTSS